MYFRLSYSYKLLDKKNEIIRDIPIYIWDNCVKKISVKTSVNIESHK